MATNITIEKAITLGGVFSPINGLEFLGQSEVKGTALYKCNKILI